MNHDLSLVIIGTRFFVISDYHIGVLQHRMIPHAFIIQDKEILVVINIAKAVYFQEKALYK